MEKYNVDSLISETATNETDVKVLQEQVDQLRECISNENQEFETSDELVAKLKSENLKLKHRLAILNRAIAVEKSKLGSSSIKMESIQDSLAGIFDLAIRAAFPDLTDPPVVIALSGNHAKFGDYQCNSALPIANLYKQQGKKIVPRDIAVKILEKVEPGEIIDKLVVAGPGFINVFLSKSHGVEVLKTIFEQGVLPPQLEKPQRVIVDFSSPNIAKEMHVGHLRSTIIGESICRLLEYLGHDVVRLNHVGDWGTQFGMLIAHLQDEFPDYLTRSPPIGDLQAFYKASKARFDGDAEFKKRAYACVVRLQAFDDDYTKAWQMICDVSRKEFQKVYDRLDITITERGESFYQSRMNDVVKELKSLNLLEEDDGRMVMWGTDAGNEGIPMTIVKSDGGYTYDTSDMAAIKHRLHEEKGDWLVYVTDAGQATHFDLLFKCARRAGILTEDKRVDHVGFGVVLGEDKKKFKTRSGDTVRLTDLLDEGLRRALEKLLEKQREAVLTPEELQYAQQAVAYGCIKYSDLSHNRNGEYVFSFDKMLEDKGNTAVYLLYAYTRIRSIVRGAGISEEEVKEMAGRGGVGVEHEKEWKLGKILMRFPDVLIKITRDLCLHHLCEYLYEVSTGFTEFYDVCYCVEKDKAGNIIKINEGRILLAEATALVMEKCFHILGIKTVSKM